MKGKGEKERYTPLNSEFQRIARRDKKAVLSDQCKKKKKRRKTVEQERLEISSRKLEIAREHFMQKMGTIKHRNDMNLKDIKILRGGQNT